MIALWAGPEPSLPVWLMSALDINDTQPAVSQTDISIDVNSHVVRAAMCHRVPHAFHYLGRDGDSRGVRDTEYSAHQLFLTM